MRGRIFFMAVAAVVVGAAFALWFDAEPEPVVSAAAPPPPTAAAAEAPDPAPLAELDLPRPDPVSVPQPPPARGSEPEAVEAPPAPVVAQPRLEEETVEVSAPLAFEPDLGEGGEGAVDAPERASVPVDADRSGALIRRMLALYRELGD